ncbi:hypothetical protein [Desulfosporosinus sp. SB140]|uniref:hypothetical protein n=1 Tax=Desulfosporosinus paludis TaxID=3115649 RepID=UPI00388E1E4C
MLNSLLKFTDSVHKIGKMKDSIRIGLLGGLIGAITIDLSNLLLYKAKKTEATFGQIAAQFFVTPTSVRKRKRLFLGELLHLAVGSVLGIPLQYILKRTGKDHYLSKGLVASLLTWIILYNGGQKMGLLKTLLSENLLCLSAQPYHLWTILSKSYGIVSRPDIFYAV